MAKIRTKQKKKTVQNPNTFLKKILQSILDEERGGIHYHHNKKTATDLLWGKDHLASMIQKENQIKTRSFWHDKI